MKKSLLALSITIALLLVGCGTPSTASGDPSNDTNTQEPQETEVVILDNDKVKVIYAGIREIDVETVGYSYLNLRIENKTDTEIWVTMPSCNVDKETVPFIIQGATTIYIQPGNIYPATFGIQMFNLSIDSLKTAKEISFTLKAVAKENISEVVFEESMKIELNK